MVLCILAMNLVPLMVAIERRPRKYAHQTRPPEIAHKTGDVVHASARNYVTRTFRDHTRKLLRGNVRIGADRILRTCKHTAAAPAERQIAAGAEPRLRDTVRTQDYPVAGPDVDVGFAHLPVRPVSGDDLPFAYALHLFGSAQMDVGGIPHLDDAPQFAEAPVEQRERRIAYLPDRTHRKGVHDDLHPFPDVHHPRFQKPEGHHARHVRHDVCLHSAAEPVTHRREQTRSVVAFHYLHVVAAGGLAVLRELAVFGLYERFVSH